MPSKRKPQRPKRSRAPGEFPPTVAPNPFPNPAAGPELKWNTLSINDQQLYHNVPLALFNATSILDILTSGSTSVNRVGSEITLKGVSLRILLNSKDTRPNVTYRVTLVAIPGVSSSSDAFSEQFFTNASHIALNAPPIPGIAKVYFDRIIQPSASSVTPLTSGGTNKERSVHVSFDVPFNHHVRYQTDGTASTRLMCWINAYDAYGTLTTDNIASIPNAVFACYFTDV